MSTVYNSQGTLVSATSGAGRRVAITTVANSTPIQITASGHGFYTGDTVSQEGTSVSAANGQFQITVVDANNYLLNGTTAAGAGSGGYAIDYELQPAYTIPANGELLDMGEVGPVLEGLSNPFPWLYQRTGKWSFYNQYIVTQGDYLSLPYTGNPWSTQSSFSSTSFVALNNASWTLESMSSNTGLPPIFLAGDLVEYCVSFTAFGNVGSGSTEYAYVNVGATIAPGGVVAGGGAMNMLLQPFQMVTLYGASAIIGQPPGNITASGAFILGSVGAPFSDLALTIGARLDAIVNASSCLVNLIGPCTGWINQYRAN